MKRYPRVLAASSLSVSVLLLSLVPGAQAGASGNRSRLASTFKSLQSDWNTVIAGLKANDETKAETGFVSFSRDSVTLATFETSFSTTINADIYTVAIYGNAWAWVGYITLTTSSSVTAFQSQTKRLNSAMDKFASDLSKGL